VNLYAIDYELLCGVTGKKRKDILSINEQ